VEKEGISFVGKRGVLSIAKALSDESIPENKGVLLEVIQSILIKMNGDIQKLVRLCDRNLSDRARHLIEERWAKMDRKEPFSEPQEIDSDRISVPVSELRVESDAVGIEGISAVSARKTSNTASQAAGVDASAHEVRVSSAVGTAAVLRARLLKVRERGKDTENDHVVKVGSTPGEPLEMSGRELFNRGIDTIQSLVSVRHPLEDTHPRLLATVECLKQFHAALSKQQAHGINLSTVQLFQLREQLMLQLHVATKHVTR
jgi:hypothetical protein